MKCFRILSVLVIAAALHATSVAQPRERSERANPAPPSLIIDERAIDRDRPNPTSFAPVVKKVASSVVNIYTTKTIQVERRLHPLMEDPLFRHFFGEPEGGPRTRREQSLGSGVIVSKDGYILTSSHVVEGAEEIKVALPHEVKTFTAKLIGTDPQTDIAVIKVDGAELPAATITDSENLEVGDVVLAIGNPFNVGQTVTMGIVSAVGRGGFGIVDYEDFIQTDASINPGNSGGALVDAEGRVVGINTAILSRTGGNLGVGFAIPINMARSVMERTVQYGRVVRGFLGVQIQSITPELASQFDLEEPMGALVAEVPPNTPAAKAGLRAGDVILEFNGKKVSDARQLRLMTAQTPPGSKAELTLIRAGKERKAIVNVGELPQQQAAAEPPTVREPSGAERPEALGLQLSELDPRLRREFGIPVDLRGALVANVVPGSTAFNSGLRPGDVITEVNRQSVRNARETADLIRKNKGKALLLRIWRTEMGVHYLVIEPPPAR